jgi:DNA-binding NarL/FixJ family response regulator
VIRVFIVSAQAISRAGLQALITARSIIEVVGSARSFPNALRAENLEDESVDVWLVELDQTGNDFLNLLPQLNAEPEAPRRFARILVLTDEWQTAWALEALRNGISAVLPRDASAEEIIAAIEAVAAGLIALHPEALDSLAALPETSAHALPSIDSLTPRELEVLGMMSEGLGNKTIAYRLNISEHTVKFHVGSIFAKLNASSRTEAVTQAIRQGLIML